MQIDGSSLTLEAAFPVLAGDVSVELSPNALPRIRASREVIRKVLQTGQPVYGINTGFGKLAEVRIPDSNLAQLQENLVRSHACGVGEPIADEAVRALLLFKANTLAKGYSGIRPEVIKLLLALLNKDVLPVVPSQGSVGASGDLAPLAHMALVLMGEGEVRSGGKRMPAAAALARHGLQPVQLQAKEGLALLNGTHFMTGLGAVNYRKARQLVLAADIIGAISAEALLCTPSAFDVRIHSVRGVPGQERSARRLREMMLDSEIRASHIDCNRVQDPYSVRCMPQVHGAIADNLRHIAAGLTQEMNAATDNPLIFSEDEVILSGGNFHGHPIATHMDLMAILMAQLSNISERRIEFMMDPALSSLPAFLTEASGINSGFMIAQVTAASLVSENKGLSHPASVDSIPTSANKEDYVTMGAHAAVKAGKVIDNAAHVLGIELLCACQSLDLRQPLQPGPAGSAVLQQLRKRVPRLHDDRVMADDIALAAKMILNGEILQVVEDRIYTEV